MRGIFNPNTIATSVIFLFDNITVQGLAFFLPTIVASIYPEASTIQKQLHTVPPYVVGAFFVSGCNGSETRAGTDSQGCCHPLRHLED